MSLTRRIFLAGSSLVAMAGGAFAAQPSSAKGDTVWLFTKDGKVVIRLRPDLAPKAVAQLKTLISQGFYNGLTFHRVISGFMAQTGDPTGTGAGGSKLPDLPAEFTSTPFKRGTVGMARTNDPNSANSQFFICLADSDFLNGQYTVVGQVVSGMSVVDKIKKGDPQSGAVDDPDKIVRMELAPAA
jgi:peptidylprolyl isomerase